MDAGDLIGGYGAVLATLLALREWRASRVVLTGRADEVWDEQTPTEQRVGWGHHYEFTFANEGPRPVAIREAGLLIRVNYARKPFPDQLIRRTHTLQPGEWWTFTRRSSEIVERLSNHEVDPGARVVGLYVETASGREIRFIDEHADFGDTQGPILNSTIAGLRGHDEPFAIDREWSEAQEAQRAQFEVGCAE